MAKKVESDTPKTGVDRWRAATHTEASDKSRSKKLKNNVAAQNVRLLVVAVVLCVAALGCCYGFLGSLTRSVDLTGGTEMSYAVSSSDASSDDLSKTTGIIKSRLTSRGVSGANVKQGDGTVLVDLPTSADADSLSTIGQTGKVEFVRVDEIGDAEAMAKIQNGTEDVKLESGSYTSFLDESHITSASISYTTSSSSSSTSSTSLVYLVVVNFDEEGAETFASVTKELAESSGQIAIVVDGVVKSAPSVSEEITGGQVSISGNFTYDEARQLKTVLDSGSLPVELELEGSYSIEPTLSLFQAFIGYGIALAVILLVGLIVFRFSGLLLAGAPALAAALAMACLAVFSAAGASFVMTLPALVAVIVSTVVALAAAATMLVRFRSAVASGTPVRSAALAVADSVVRPAATVFVVALVVGIVLLFVGSSDAQGIALAIAFGVAGDGAAILLLAIPALRVLGLGAASKKPGLWGVKGALAAAQKNAAASTSEAVSAESEE